MVLCDLIYPLPGPTPFALTLANRCPCRSKEELNRAANAAKHEGLGIDDPDEDLQRRDEKRRDEQD